MSAVRRGGLLRLALLALLWGSNFLWIKVALRGLSPVQLTLVRLVLGAAVLLSIARAQRLGLPRGAGAWGRLAVAALVGNALPYWLFAAGEQHVASSLAGALNATTPLWTLGIGLALRTEAVSPARGLGMLLGFLGVLVILLPGAHVDLAGSAAGGLLCLGAAASYAVSYVYMGRYLTGRGLTPLVLSAGQLTAATGLLLLATPVGGLRPVHLSAAVAASVAVLGVLGTGAAYVLNYRLIGDDGPTIASTVTYLLPVVSVSLGAAVLGEPVRWQLLAGTAMVLAGVALVRAGAAAPFRDLRHP